MTKKQLPERDVQLLDSWLENGGDLAEFFSIGGDLGESSEYDLTRWQGEGGKKPLPAAIQDRLNSGWLKVSDLALMAETSLLEGDVTDYDLSAWE